MNVTDPDMLQIEENKIYIHTQMAIQIIMKTRKIKCLK